MYIFKAQQSLENASQRIIITLYFKYQSLAELTTMESASLPVRLVISVDGTWDTSEGSYDAIKGKSDAGSPIAMVFQALMLECHRSYQRNCGFDKIH